MAIKTCRRCRKPVSTKLVTCPHCDTAYPSLGLADALEVCAMLGAIAAVLIFWA